MEAKRVQRRISMEASVTEIEVRMTLVEAMRYKDGDLIEHQKLRRLVNAQIAPYEGNTEE